jgi:anti-anti-sigma factor
MLSIQQHENDGVHIVKLDGEAGSAEAWEVGAIVGRLIESHPAKLLFDLTGLTFISSLALGELVRLANDLSRYECRVGMAGMQPKIQEVLRLLRFDQYYEMYETIDDAVAAMR